MGWPGRKKKRGSEFSFVENCWSSQPSQQIAPISDLSPLFAHPTLSNLKTAQNIGSQSKCSIRLRTFTPAFRGKSERSKENPQFGKHVAIFTRLEEAETNKVRYKAGSEGKPKGSRQNRGTCLILRFAELFLHASSLSSNYQPSSDLTFPSLKPGRADV